MLGWRRRSTADGPRRVWLDLGRFRILIDKHRALEQWQDHGMGLLRTILRDNGLATDLASTRACRSWRQVRRKLRGYDVLIMNVRSYTFPMAYRAAKIFKELNPKGIVLTGGMHATVALGEMTAIEEFDKICQGPGEGTIVDLVRDPGAFPRVITGTGARSMGDWPMIDRTLWPRPTGFKLKRRFHWPLEPTKGWGPAPVVTLLTSRVCPWQCSFCNENSYIANMERKPVDMVIEELNHLDRNFGPIGSVVIHDSMFFQNPVWLKEWIEKYPRKARRTWPYWAAARADTVRQWPDLFEALIRETNWMTVSIGFESGSDRILKVLNKECTEEDNFFTIELLEKVGDDLERQGKQAPVFWSNIMLAIPGETREDAFKTMRMLKYMRRVIPAISYYAPYPGSVLGHQLIAEGKSLMTKENYHRFAGDEKVKGIDYPFYKELLEGKYDAEINSGLPDLIRQRKGAYTDSLLEA